MKRRKFIIGVSAAGLTVPQIASANLPTGHGKEHPLIASQRDERRQLYAQHRSHQSHSSHRSSSGGGSGHRSHSSHRSSSGGGGSTGSSRRSSSSRSNSSPASSILPKRSTYSNPLLSPANFTDTAKRVQRELKTLGYYDGAIDGIIGKGSRASLKAFQKDFSLTVTGTITPEVLKALNIT